MKQSMPARNARWLLAAIAVATVAVGLPVWLRSARPTQEPTDDATAPPWSAGPAQSASAPAGASPIALADVTRQTGIAFRHTDGSAGHYYIMETVSAGLATFDYDGDGLIDVYFLTGTPLRGAQPDPTLKNRLYRNLGGWRFADVTDQAGVGGVGYGLGVAVGDYDNDGHPDLYVSNFGPNVLWRNNGDGTFTDVTRQAGVAGIGQVGAGVCFLDADGDGHLDLYVANYLKFSYDNHVAVTIRGVPAYAGPDRYPPLADILYRNNGDGTFRDASEESGVGRHASWGMGMVCADYDNDGDTDVFVANDVAANFLFRNDGHGRFEEVGLAAGAAYDVYGSPQGSMGVDCGDWDNDGLLDFYQTSYQLQHAVLYRNLGHGAFEDVSLSTGAAAGTYAHVTWGCGLVDFANRGRRDIFVACGHLHDRLEAFDRTTSYLARNLVLMNTGDGKFVNVSDQCGDGLAVRLSSRGAAFDDLDNDGRVDAVILNSRAPPTLLRNQSPGTNHWLQVRLRGVKTNRDGVGARVKVVAGALSLVDEVHSGRGYQSHYGSRLHFGLGSRDRVDRIEVRWIGGGLSVVQDPGVDRLVTVTEGAE